MTLQNGALVRLARAELDIQKLDVDKADTKDLKNIADRVHELAASVDSLRKAVVGFAFTIAAAAVVFAFTVLQLVHH